MIQMFHTLGLPELWLKPWVGQPPALWYSVRAQMAAESVNLNEAPASGFY